MLLTDYYQEAISFEDAKFAIAIALANLAENEASAAVLSYLGTNIGSGIAEKDYISQRSVILHELSKFNTGMVQSVIQYFWECPVLTRVNVTSRVHNYAHTCSLQDLLRVANMNIIYNTTMKLLFETPVKKLILAFVRTSQFKKALYHKIRKDFGLSRDNIRMNNLSDDILSEVLEDFYIWVNNYSSDGSYHASSGTPTPYLLNTFGSFYVNSTAGNIFQIINRKGQDFSLGEGNTTYTDLVGESLNERKSLHFVSICKKICDASFLLFRHGSNDVSFYDIFSYHRDKNLRVTVNSMSNKFQRLAGCKVDYDDDTTYAVNGFSSSVANKKAGRLALCDKLEEILTCGIRKEDVYRLYKQLLQITDQQSVKDGARLFSTASHSTRHLESNGQMMQILLDGYLALKELLDYLDAEGCLPGVTVNSFPVEIFRDRMYLRRFKTLEEYVSYVCDVNCLMGEIKLNSDRSKSRDDTGILSNDTVFEIMSSKKLLNDAVFTELRDMPLSIITNAVTEASGADSDTALFENLLKVSKQYRESQIRKEFSRENLQELSYVKKIALFVQITREVLLLQQQQSLTLKTVRTCIEFCECLHAVMLDEKHPATDTKGSYLLQAETIIEEFSYSSEILKIFEGYPTFYDSLAQNMKQRVLALHVICTLLTGEQGYIDPSSKLCLKGSWEELRNVFVTIDIMREYLQQVGDKFDNSYLDKKDLYLMLIRLAENGHLLCVPKVITSCDDISFLCANVESCDISGRYCLQEQLKINERRQHFILISMNRLLHFLSPQLDVLTVAYGKIQQSIKTYGRTVLPDKELETILRNANASILGSSVCHTIDNRIRQKLSALVDFDDLNFAVFNLKRFCIDNRKYIHSDGIVVNVDLLNKTFQLEDLTEDELNLISSRLVLGG